MKKIMGVVFGVMFLMSAGLAYAIPSLQLDIFGGTYDPITETIIAPTKSFDLYAYLIPDKKATLASTYYVIAAVTPKLTVMGNYGTLGFGSFPDMAVNGEMGIGKPIAELPDHGIFDTSYWLDLNGFIFDSANQINPYNTQDRAINGDPIVFSGSGMYYKKIPVDVTNLAEGYHIHFDLFGYDDAQKIQFAPFSHDAQSNGNKVPEPATLLLLGAGLVGLIGLKRRMK